MRINAQRLDRIRQGLRSRDWAVIDTMSKVDIATAGQLRRLHWPEPNTARTARRRLSRLAELRILHRLERRIGGVRAGSDGYVYRLDSGGRRLLGEPSNRRPHTPGRAFLHHAIAVTEIYVQTVETSRSDLVELLEFQAEPQCWREWGTGILKPDAHLVTATPDFEDHWFIEVDRATESIPTIRRKASVYEHYEQTGIEQEKSGVFPRVLWVAPDERRAAQLVEALAHGATEHWRLHQVVTDSAIPTIFNS